MTYEIRTTDVFDGLAAMPEKSVHCCVTSPPYWALRDYGVPGQLGQEATPQEFVATLVRVFGGVWRVLRDDGVLFVNLGDSYADKSRCLIPERFVLAMQEFGWYVRDIIVWHKPAPMPVSVRDRCTPAWEPIYQFTKSPRYFWDQEAVKVATLSKPHAPGNKKLDASRNDHAEMAKIWGIGGANPRNVWRISTEPLKPADKDVMTNKTVAWKPTCQCNADTIPATVLDPFSGAGTTCLAAARLGRHGIGLELNPEYVNLSIQRIETELAKHAAAQTKMVRPAKVASQPGCLDLSATLE